MTTKRAKILAGAVLGAVLLVGTAGLALAQDPTATPAPSFIEGMPGGMMGGQGMMGRMDGGQMSEMHQAMGQDGTCDPERMQTIHDQYHPAD